MLDSIIVIATTIERRINIISGSKTGGIKAAKTNIERHGKDFFRIIGSKGGRVKTDKPKGFAANREIAKAAGRKAGTISKRGYKFIRQEKGFREYLDKKTGEVVRFPV